MVVAIIGALTLLLAGCSALTQWDIKRVLAYSTISQIGYMFLALGVGAWSAAIFHFMTHAFFKSLLFLAAGVVIDALHHEHDLYKMGGLRSQLPLTFWTFLIGACSLAALPFVTAGFYSKDLILEKAWQGGPWFWAAGLIGALLTSLYTFRVVFLTFFGTAQQQVSKKPGFRIQLPLVVLAVLSVASGWITIPEFLQTNLPVPYRPGVQLGLQVTAGVVAVGGIYLAYLLFLRHRPFMAKIAAAPISRLLHRFWSGGWGFDWLYDGLFVRPYVWLARVNKNDVVDLVYVGVARLSQASHRALSRTQTGRVRWYAAGIAVGAVVILILVVFL
jgi:NADH-quinone oxidoreductase subunit L